MAGAGGQRLRFAAGIVCGVLGTLVVSAALVLLWPWQVAATAPPSALEVSLLHGLLNRAVAREAPHLSNPLPPSHENLRAGLKIFRDTCAGCHGDGAHPSPWGTSSFSPRVPQFGREPPSRPDWEVHWIVTHGIRNTAMGGFAQLLSEQQAWQVASFVSRIRSLPPGIAAEWSHAERAP